MHKAYPSSTVATFSCVQELGYMSRRGHTTGIISTYYNTWLLKTDRKGTLWVTDAIPFDATGTDTEPSVTEVCHIPCNIGRSHVGRLAWLKVASSGRLQDVCFQLPSSMTSSFAPFRLLLTKRTSLHNRFSSTAL